MDKLTVHGIQCLKCKQIIYSRATHDFHSCECESVYIDGGFDYMRVGGIKSLPCVVELENVTKADLYRDWNLGIDKYGWMYPKDTKKT